jgi:CHRD domain
MKTFAGFGLMLTMAILIGPADFSAAQHAGMGMTMPMNTLLVVQLDAKQVAGGSSSSATGTGTLLLDPVQHTLAYNLTYQGLEAGSPSSIALYNFGRGKAGKILKVLCGSGSRPCPGGPSATISGRLERSDDFPLDNNLIGEFDSGRVYVEIVGGNGKPEIRGQLGANGAMVRVANYIAHLAPALGADSKGSGTAIFSETYLPGGKVSVFYAATVAGTSGALTNAVLVRNPAPTAPRMTLPHLKLRFSRDRQTGGSLSGIYDINSTAPNALSVARVLSAGSGEAGLVVTTSRFPNGELYGALVPVR